MTLLSIDPVAGFVPEYGTVIIGDPQPQAASPDRNIAD